MWPTKIRGAQPLGFWPPELVVSPSVYPSCRPRFAGQLPRPDQGLLRTAAEIESIFQLQWYRDSRKLCTHLQRKDLRRLTWEVVHIRKHRRATPASSFLKPSGTAELASNPVLYVRCCRVYTTANSLSSVRVENRWPTSVMKWSKTCNRRAWKQLL